MERCSDNISGLQDMANRMRRRIFDMALGVGSASSHIAPALSITDIMAVLYGAVLRIDPGNPTWPERDRFILSKGHGAMGWYAALAEAGFLSDEEIMAFGANASELTTHPVYLPAKGIEYASGSLGMGLGLGVGIALAARKKNLLFQTYVLIGDGESNEGSVWEGVMAGAQFGLGSLTAIVDANGMQSDGKSEGIMNMGSHEDKWRAFGWESVSARGNDIADLLRVFNSPRMEPDKPRAVIAHTVKGKGVSFMEHNNEWHHNRLSKAQYDSAVAELAI
jgi:transketolase